MESNYNYNVVASAVLDMLQNLGKHQGPYGGIYTDVNYLPPVECSHLYKFLEPYVKRTQKYRPLLDELLSAAFLKYG